MTSPSFSLLYLDTSALIKLYIEEPGSAEVWAKVADAQIVATSRVAYVEARAGMARKRREGEWSAEEYQRLLKDFTQDWENYFIIEVTEGLTRLGGELTGRYPLRGFDAIHLASAILLRNRTHGVLFFCCFDTRLSEAARAEGLHV